MTVRPATFCSHDETWIPFPRPSSTSDCVLCYSSLASASTQQRQAYLRKLERLVRRIRIRRFIVHRVIDVQVIRNVLRYGFEHTIPFELTSIEELERIVDGVQRDFKAWQADADRELHDNHSSPPGFVEI